jgi:hypothetical protein
MTGKLALLCLALATATAAAHPCPATGAAPPRATRVSPAKAPSEQQVATLVQKASDRIRVAAIVDADAASKLGVRLRTIKATHALETAPGRVLAAAALEKLAADAEAVLP